MSKDNPNYHRETRVTTAGRKEEWTGQVVNPPIWRGSTHLYSDVAALEAGKSTNEDGRFFYGRRGSPTQWALCDALTKLEPGAFGTVLYPSGTAALAGALFSVLKAGDVLLMADNIYDPTRGMANGLFKQMGVETRFFNPLDLDDYRSKFCDRTKAVMLENPGSLTMELCDIPTLARLAREKGAVSLIDNTWASSLGFAALEHGCDISIMALTKHVGGHSDVMMGSASAAERYYRRLRRTAQQLGHVVSPDDAALVMRGLPTMALRLERSSQSALQIARWLQDRKEVSHVLCPMLPGTRGHEVWQRDFTGGCGLFSFVLRDADKAARARFVDALDLFGIGYSWGGFESLALPFDPGHIRTASTWPPVQWGTGEHLGIRLSVGLEHAADLIEDLENGFAAMENS
ncbi:cystathionine beta-lyase [Pontixanthobacter aquaemixtae]|uniref:Cystathionine beta-lyase n=1 Tax=Pontixanthobacter aquaemixtae TaxID=1958940 RepID=A0A844ZP97_9SPHN|nr:cystathionine beta-lyase [Pontixanthobacter aquaemixtae]MXO89568.1 cystathionine beta-lyase [Pontixanthobacter aquaemixtae]